MRLIRLFELEFFSFVVELILTGRKKCWYSWFAADDGDGTLSGASSPFESRICGGKRKSKDKRDNFHKMPSHFFPVLRSWVVLVMCFFLFLLPFCFKCLGLDRKSQPFKWKERKRNRMTRGRDPYIIDNILISILKWYDLVISLFLICLWY